MLSPRDYLEELLDYLEAPECHNPDTFERERTTTPEDRATVWKFYCDTVRTSSLSEVFGGMDEEGRADRIRQLLRAEAKRHPDFLSLYVHTVNTRAKRDLLLQRVIGDDYARKLLERAIELDRAYLNIL